MTSSPDPQPRRRSLTGDELIAILVAFASLGTIFFWSIRQGDQGFNLSFLQPLATPSPTPSQPDPLVSPSAEARPTIAASPQPAPTQPAPIPESPTPAPSAQAQTVPFRAAPVPVPVEKTVKPSPSPTPTTSPQGRATKFSDVPADFWASGYIAALTDREVVDGFPDGTFQPNKPVTRAEFAEMVRRGFDQPAIREGLVFNDVPATYWATPAIDEAVRSGFLNGYPGGTFQPNQEIPKFQAQIALASGLNLTPQAPPEQVLGRYQDAGEVPTWAAGKISAATESGVVVSYPDPQKLAPNQVTTRAEAAALIYQALKKQGKV